MKPEPSRAVGSAPASNNTAIAAAATVLPTTVLAAAACKAVPPELSRASRSAPASSKATIAADESDTLASCNGVFPSELRTSSSAPASSNAAIAARLFVKAAACNAVRPSLSRASTSAPAATSAAINFGAFAIAAMCNGVRPLRESYTFGFPLTVNGRRTVISTESDTLRPGPRTVAVIVAVPWARAVTLPSSSTEAMAGSDDSQVNSAERGLPLWSRAVASSCEVTPRASRVRSAGEMEIVATVRGGAGSPPPLQALRTTTAKTANLAVRGHSRVDVIGTAEHPSPSTSMFCPIVQFYSGLTGYPKTVPKFGRKISSNTDAAWHGDFPAGIECRLHLACERRIEFLQDLEADACRSVTHQIHDPVVGTELCNPDSVLLSARKPPQMFPRKHFREFRGLPSGCDRHPRGSEVHLRPPCRRWRPR